jgi:ferrous iron transport protein B
VINVVDATNLERNLYLTLLLLELGVPVLMAVTMMDIARSRKISVDLDHLSRHLGCPVVGVNALDKRDIQALATAVADAAERPRISPFRTEFPDEVEREIGALESGCTQTAAVLRTSPRWVAVNCWRRPVGCAELAERKDLASAMVADSVRRSNGYS